MRQRHRPAAAHRPIFPNWFLPPVARFGNASLLHPCSSSPNPMKLIKVGNAMCDRTAVIRFDSGLANFKACARIATRAEKTPLEHRGYKTTIGLDGLPTDPRHPVYRNS